MRQPSRCNCSKHRLHTIINAQDVLKTLEWLDALNTRELYDNGLSDMKIAARLGCSMDSVSRWRRKNNLPAKNKSMKANRAKIVDLYNSGMFVSEIAAQLHVGQTTVRRALKEMNIDLRYDPPHKPKPEPIKSPAPSIPQEPEPKPESIQELVIIKYPEPVKILEPIQEPSYIPHREVYTPKQFNFFIPPDVYRKSRW